jgi:hypothetical protein
MLTREVQGVGVATERRSTGRKLHFSVALSPEQRERLDERATVERRSAGDVMRLALDCYLDGPEAA